MLSRVAERTYWMSRYLERAENTARLINVYSALLLDLPKSANLGWEVVLAITGVTPEELALSREDSDAALLDYLLCSDANPGSLLASINAVRENARTTRDIVPTEGWRAVNELNLYAREVLPTAIDASDRAQIMSQVISRVHGITGLLAGTMSRGQPYQFVLLGRNLERADMTTRMVNVAASVLMTGRTELKRYESTLWMTVLRCLSGYQMYRQYVRRRVNGPDVIGFLLQDPNFPRAVTHCATEIGAALQKLPRPDAPLEKLAPVPEKLARIDPPALGERDIHLLMEELQMEFALVNDAIAATWHYPAESG